MAKQGKILEQLVKAIQETIKDSPNTIVSSNVKLTDINEVQREIDVLVETIQKDGLVSDSDQGFTVILDTNLTDELIEEGFVREFISKVQNMRKDSGFEITDRSIVTLPDTEETRSCLNANYDYVVSQVLATEVRFAGDAIAVEKV